MSSSAILSTAAASAGRSGGKWDIGARVPGPSEVASLPDLSVSHARRAD